MNSLSNSENALDKFAKKIDFANLTGNPDDFYKAGLAFVENGQYDDGIIEFVKTIKTTPHQDILFANAVKELKSMGFSSADISAISGSPETVKDIIADTVSTASAPVASKRNTLLPGVMIVTIIVILFWCLSIDSDTSPEGYERSGNLIYAALVLGPFFLLPLIIVISIIRGSLTTQKLSNTSSNEKKSKKEDQIDLLPIAVIGGIILIITLLMSLPYLLSYL